MPRWNEQVKRSVGAFRVRFGWRKHVVRLEQKLNRIEASVETLVNAHLRSERIRRDFPLTSTGDIRPHLEAIIDQLRALEAALKASDQARAADYVHAISLSGAILNQQFELAGTLKELPSGTESAVVREEGHSGGLRL